MRLTLASASIAMLIAGCGETQTKASAPISPAPPAEPKILVLQCDGIARDEEGERGLTRHIYRLDVDAKRLQHWNAINRKWMDTEGTLVTSPIAFRHIHASASDGVLMTRVVEVDRVTSSFRERTRFRTSGSGLFMTTVGTCKKVEEASTERAF